MEAEIISYSFIHNGFNMTFGNTNKKNVFCRELGNMQNLVHSSSIWISSNHCFVLILVGGQTGKQVLEQWDIIYCDLLKI